MNGVARWNNPQILHNFRKDIDTLIQYARGMKLSAANETGAREIAIVYTKLQEAKMWVGKVLEECGEPLPPEFQDKA